MFPLSKKMGVFSLSGMRVLSSFEVNVLTSVPHIICVPFSYHISLFSVFRRLLLVVSLSCEFELEPVRGT